MKKTHLHDSHIQASHGEQMHRPLGSITFLLLSLCTASAQAGIFDGVPILEDVEEAVTDVAEGAVDALDDVLKIVGDGLEDLSEEGEKLVRKTFREIENVGKDIEDLAKTGKCSSDICDAIAGVAEYTEEVAQGAGDALKDAERRVSEGRLLDAMWHLSIAPMDIQQEAAAHAATKSTVLRAIGQAAATAYGGPGGAAAYSAWLTYHQTDGDLEAAFKAGVISGATSYAIGEINSGAEFNSIGDEIAYGAILQRAVMTGAVSGAAVAMAGGDEEDVKEAFLKGAVTSVIREGYRQLTHSDLEENLKASNGLAYCLGANPNAMGEDGARLPCLPEAHEYIPKDGNVVVVDENGTIDLNSIRLDAAGKPEVNFLELDYGKPHVGTWSSLESEGFFGTGETSGLMTGISRVPGMNGMAVAHDIFDDTFNPESSLIVEQVIRVGSIAPFIIMTYEGAGFSVQEMIRDAAQSSVAHERADNDLLSPGQPGGESYDAAATPITPGLEAIDNAQSPNFEGSEFEIAHLICVNRDGREANYLLERALGQKEVSSGSRVCRVDQYVSEDTWIPTWHAHHDRSFCLSKINNIMRRLLAKGYSCAISRGLKIEMNTDSAALE